MNTCYLRVCAGRADRRGLCAAHYQRKQRGMDLNVTIRRPLFKERFFQKIAHGGRDECWEWTAAKSSGYGQIKRGGKRVLAHRVAYEAMVGPIPDGMYVCHHCDNPSCVNPHHLFLGDQSDNMRDAWEKRRIQQPPGADYQFTTGHRPANRNIGDSKARRIKKMLDETDLTHQEIGTLVGAKRQTVADISAGRSYANVELAA